MMAHTVFIFLLSAFFSACTINVRLVEKEPLVKDEVLNSLKAKEGNFAMVTIGDVDVPGKVVSVSRDALGLITYDEVSEIPLKAVREIKFIGKSVSTGSMATGFVIGGVTGGLAGEAIADHAKPFEKESNQLGLKIASAAVGGILGILASRSLSGVENPGSFVINPDIKIHKFDKKIGKTIPGLTVAQQGLFQDFQLKAGEQLLRVKIFEYDQDEFLAMFEIHNGYNTVYRWETVDAAYLQAQRSKIKLPIQNEMFKEELKNDPLKIFKEESNQ